MAAGTLENLVLCVLLILYSKKESRKRHLTLHTERETGLVGFLFPTCKERVGREPVALGREAAVSLGETSSGSARQAGKRPRAERENRPPPTCYYGALKGLRMAGFLVAMCSQRTSKQIVADNSGSIPLS